MALLTTLSLEAARAIGVLYGLAVVDVRGLREGSVNSNFELSIDGGGGPATRVFLRIYEEIGVDDAARETRLVVELADLGVPTPTPLGRIDGGGALAEHAGKPVAIFPWIEGTVLCQAAVRPEHAYRVGAGLARIHAAGANVGELGPTRFSPAQLVERLAALDTGSVGAETARAITSLQRALEDAEEGPVDGLIHGDLFRDNVLWHAGELAGLLDFESASRGSFAFDIAVTLLAWCFGDDFEPPLARALVGGYQSIRPLNEGDRDSLFPSARFAALRFAATRIADFELRSRDAGVYKDYRRFLARADALDRLGPRGLDALVGLGPQTEPRW